MDHKLPEKLFTPSLARCTFLPSGETTTKSKSQRPQRKRQLPVARPNSDGFQYHECDTFLPNTLPTNIYLGMRTVHDAQVVTFLVIRDPRMLSRYRCVYSHHGPVRFVGKGYRVCLSAPESGTCSAYKKPFPLSLKERK